MLNISNFHVHTCANEHEDIHTHTPHTTESKGGKSKRSHKESRGACPQGGSMRTMSQREDDGAIARHKARIGSGREAVCHCFSGLSRDIKSKRATKTLCAVAPDSGSREGPSWVGEVQLLAWA